MTSYIPKIAKSYFNQLLTETGEIEAVSRFSQFWGHRLDANKRYFGLTQTEYFCEICLIYTGEVSNGGHAQFFGNRGTKLIADIEIALKRIGCEKHAKVLSDAAKKVSHLEICTWIDWDIIPKTAFDFWESSDQKLWSFEDVDGALLNYLRDSSDSILLPERDLVID